MCSNTETKLNAEIILGHVRLLAHFEAQYLNKLSVSEHSVASRTNKSISFILSTLIYLETVSQDDVTTGKFRKYIFCYYLQSLQCVYNE